MIGARSVLAGLLASLWFISCHPTSLDEDSFQGQCVAVLDGDTIDVRRADGTVRVRLHGIDTPERTQPFSQVARKRTAELAMNRPVRVDIRDHAHLKGRFYLRFMVDDHPGVLAQISGVLGRHEVSIASVIQHAPEPDGHESVVPLVIMTHMTTEGATADAVKEIDQLDCVVQGSERMRVLD